MSWLILSPILLSLSASAPVELADLEPATFNRGSNPTLGAELNGSGYFFTDDPDSSHRSLWKTDGTAAGTSRVARLPPGQQPKALTAATNRLFAITYEPLSGSYTLWRSDGISTLQPVTTIPQYTTLGGGNVAVDPVFAAAGANVVFAAGSPPRLWGSDGTAAGTVDLGVTRLNATRGSLRSFGDRALAIGGIGNTELWSTDGTPAGTVLVHQGGGMYAPLGIELGYAWFYSGNLLSWDGGFPVELRDAGSYVPYQNEASANGLFYFTCGSAFLSSNGTSLTNANCSLPAAQPASMLGVGNTLYIQTTYQTHALYLFDGGTFCDWKSIGGNFTSPVLTKVGNRAFFTMDTSATGDEPAISEGASGDPEVLLDIRPGTGSSSPLVLTTLGNTVLFSADDGLIGRELYSTDGTSGGTGLVSDVNSAIYGYGSHPADFTPLGSGVAFTAETFDAGRQVWITDGGTTTAITAVSSPLDGGMAVMGGTLYFAGGSNLYRADSTADGGASKLRSFSGSQVGHLTATSDKLFFTVDDTLWKSDGTASFTLPIRQLAATPSAPLFAIGSRVLVVEAGSLHSDDGTVHEVLAADVTANPVLGPDGRAWYGLLNGEVWSTDGTSAGRRKEGQLSTHVMALAHTSGTVLVFGGDGGTQQLWRIESDGGALSVFDFGAQTLKELAALKSSAVFTMGDASSWKLWSSNGTDTFAVPVSADGGGGRATELRAGGGIVYFSADDGVAGAEPWRTDGTIEGTRRIADLEPGAVESFPRHFQLSGDLLTFAASTVGHGEEPWGLRVDPTPPVVSVTPSDTTGWFNGDVAVSFAVTDPESSITRIVGCDGGSVVTDTPGQVFDCGAASEGGFTHAQVTVRRDATAPTISCPSSVTEVVLTPSTPVSYPDAVVSDNLDPSPVVTYDPPRDQPFARNGATVNVTATDRAGNNASCSFDVKLESGATPTVTCLDSVVREPTDKNGLILTEYPPEAVSGFDEVDGTQLQFEYDPPPGAFAAESTTPVKVTAINSGRHRSEPCTFNLSVTCTSDECRAKLAQAKKRSEYAFGCNAAGGALGFAPVAWLLLLAIRRRRFVRLTADAVTSAPHAASFDPRPRVRR